VKIGWIIYLVSFVLGSRRAMVDAGFTRYIKQLHPFCLLIVCFYLPLVVDFRVGIWSLLPEFMTIVVKMGEMIVHNDTV
jgi:hypothetical protein